MALSFIGPGGWDQNAWLDYWRALWSAPTQPGYPILVREGLARLRIAAQWQRDQATLLGAQSELAAVAERVEPIAILAAQALSQLPTYQAIAAGTDDPATLGGQTANLLDAYDSPLQQIGRAFGLLVAFDVLLIPTVQSTVHEKIVKPLAKVAKVTGAIAGGVWGIAKWVLIGFGVYLVADAFGGDGGGE